MPFDPLLLPIYALALASVARLVTGTDTLTERANGWVVAKIEALADWSLDIFDSRPWTAGWVAIKITRGLCWFVAKMISCMWCAPFWLSVPMLAAMPYWQHPCMWYPALALALRQFVGMTSQMGR